MQINRTDISDKDCAADVAFLRSCRDLRLDAGEALSLARELIYQRAALKAKLFPEFKGRSLVPVSNEIDPGAEEHSYVSMTRLGKAEVTNNYSTKSPRLDAFLGETLGKIKGLRGHYSWTIQDLRRAALAGRPLKTMKAEVARSAIEEAIDYNIAFGIDGTAITGLLNNANAGTATPPTGTWVLGTTAGEDMLADLDFAVNKGIDDTNDIEHPDTLVLPPKQFQILNTTKIGTSSDKSALKAYLENATYIKNIIPWWRCKTAGSGSTTRAVLYKRDPSKLVADIPQEFEQFAPQLRSMEYIVECHARVAGVTVYYPKSIYYMDGI